MMKHLRDFFVELISVGDSHTTLGYRPQQGLPLMLYWFKDGIVILNTTSEYKNILHGKITALGGKPIKDVLAALATVIPHENEDQVKNKITNLLTDTVILHGMKLIPLQDSAPLTVRTTSGRTVTLDMEPLSFSSKPEWLVDTSNESDAPLYLRNRHICRRTDRWKTQPLRRSSIFPSAAIWSSGDLFRKIFSSHRRRPGLPRAGSPHRA
jgi:hypothetical protein